jgi:hypothetical protein
VSRSTRARALAYELTRSVDAVAVGLDSVGQEVDEAERQEDTPAVQRGTVKRRRPRELGMRICSCMQGALQGPSCSYM